MEDYNAGTDAPRMRDGAPDMDDMPFFDAAPDAAAPSAGMDLGMNMGMDNPGLPDPDSLMSRADIADDADIMVPDENGALVPAAQLYDELDELDQLWRVTEACRF
jgi:hypothetical protein